MAGPRVPRGYGRLSGVDVQNSEQHLHQRAAENAGATAGGIAGRRVRRGGCLLDFQRLHQPFLLWFANPEQEFLDKLLREDLERALAALPEHYRVVVVLADVEGLKYGEIAEALDVPVGTVRSRLARARSALQRTLWNVACDHGLQASRTASTHG